MFLGATLIFASCKKDSTSPDPTPEPIPATPYIYQVVPTMSEPNRGMYLTIQDNSDNENGFTLERKTSGGNFAPLTILPPNTHDYTDWSVKASTFYTYRISAFNQYGASGSTERSGTSIGPQSSPLLAYTVKDTWVDESNTGSNHGTDRNLQISGGSGFWGGQSEILTAFVLPLLPQYATGVKSAFLRICESGGGNTIYPGSIHIYAVPILNQWSEVSATWSTRPGSWLTTNGQATHDPNSTSCVSIDVSKVVQYWYNGVRPNYGFILFSNTSTSYCEYYSKEGYSPGSALLEVDYSW